MSGVVDDWAGVHIWARDCRTVGVATGTVTRCSMAGCTGIRIWVRWPDGRLTKPCSKGLLTHGGGWRIG